MITQVVHCKRESYDIYIGRPSIWGNPFTIGPDGTREDVIQKHKQKILSNPKMVARIKRELGGKVLGCWCKPKPCHGDTYVEIANEELSNDKIEKTL